MTETQEHMEMKPGNTGQRDELATGGSCCTRDKDGDIWSVAGAPLGVKRPKSRKSSRRKYSMNLLFDETVVVGR